MTPLKFNMILVDTDKQVDLVKLVEDLGFGHKLAGRESLFNSDFLHLMCGYLEEKLVLFNQDAAYAAMQVETSPIERKLAEIFPDVEICVFLVQNIVDARGIALSVNGERKRLKYFYRRPPERRAYGDLLREEQDLLDKLKAKHKDDQETIQDFVFFTTLEMREDLTKIEIKTLFRDLEENPDYARLLFERDFTEKQWEDYLYELYNEEMVSMATKRYLPYAVLGEPGDMAAGWNPFWHTRFTVFTPDGKMAEIEARKLELAQMRERLRNPDEPEKKPWWRFW